MNEITIGEFTLRDEGEDEIWICHENGEESAFSKESLERVLRKFYNDNL